MFLPYKKVRKIFISGKKIAVKVTKCPNLGFLRYIEQTPLGGFASCISKKDICLLQCNLVVYPHPPPCQYIIYAGVVYIRVGGLEFT